MTVYLDELSALNSSLNYLLLAGSARLGGGALRRRRLLAAAALGGVYAAAALVPELRFLRAGGMRAAAAVLSTYPRYFPPFPAPSGIRFQRPPMPLRNDSKRHLACRTRVRQSWSWWTVSENGTSI